MMQIFTKKACKQVELLKIETISPNPYQPRRQFEEAALNELAESIDQNGLLQPVTVRRVSDAGYELIAGERRLLACKLLGKEVIPAIVEQFSDEQSAVFALVENLQRRDLNFFEQAQGMRDLMNHLGMTQEQLAKRLGKSQPTVANKLRLLSFSDSVQQRILDHNLTERHARALLKLPDEMSVKFALDRIIEEKMNVAEAEAYIGTLLAVEEPAEQEKKKKPARLFIVRDFRIFMNTISDAISTMKMAGININTSEEEEGEYIRYTMYIPKKSAYRSSHTA